MLNKSGFTGNAQKKFLSILEEANTGLTTDIEIVSQDIVRFGLIKKLRLAENKVKFTNPELKEILDLILPEKIKREIKIDINDVLPCGFSFSVKDTGHYRVLAYLTKHGISLSIRKLPYTIPDIELLGIPESITDMFLNARGGLFIVTGPTGSGKTTTIASMLEKINQSRHCKIVTIENPIEYVYLNSCSAFFQVEVGTHVHTVQDAMYHVLRSNPEIIFMGEIRSKEEAQACLSICETGHVVVTSYHVPDSVSAIERLIYEIGDIEITKNIIASNLIGALNLRLFISDSKDSEGQLPETRFFYAFEYLPVSNNPVVRKMISEMKFSEIRKFFIDTPYEQKKTGLVSFSESIRSLYLKGLASEVLLNQHRYYDILATIKSG
ncbi:MAG: Flp pilus assembly complex ATPase component TadA [Nitrospirae bacterium]|nr:Flp pilus assembly complex ATPase component TadA [Nitrospirota bacterium]